MSHREPRIAAYWSENIRRTFTRSEAAEVVGAALVLVLAAIGWDARMDDPDFRQSAAVGVIGALLFLLLFVTPWQMWRDTTKRVIGCEERLRPKSDRVQTRQAAIRASV